MGGVIFLDTSFIIAFFNKEDTHYADAQKVVKDTLKKDPLIKFYYSDYIFDEVITQLKVRKVPPESIVAIGDTLLHSKVWKFLKLTEKDFENAWKMIKRYQDKVWSFTDASSFGVMDTYKIPFYLSYDAHFADYPNIKQWG